MMVRLKFLVLGLVLAAVVVVGHAQESDEEAVPDAAAEVASKCPPADEVDSDGEDPVSEGEGAEVSGAEESGDDECEEEVDELAEFELPTGMGEIVEEDPSVRATADEVFQPGEEISEDFPVPLPSDI